MTSASYAEKLKDPRWQRKRLEAMQAANFSCQLCFNEDETLHVHHKQYFKGREPWEYEVKQLAVLCETCHEGQHEEDDLLNTVCSFLPLTGADSRESVASLVTGFTDVDTLPLLQGKEDPFAYTAGVIARTCNQQAGNIDDILAVAEFALKDPQRLFAAMVELATAPTAPTEVPS